MKQEIFTKEDLELAFSAGYDFAEDSFNNPDNTEYVNERVALKQANGAEQSSSNCNIPLVSVAYELLEQWLDYVNGKEMSAPIDRTGEWLAKYER